MGHSNSPIGQITEAMRHVSTFSMVTIAQSRLFRTPCFPAGAGPDFVNAAALCTTTLPPEGVLQALHAVEAAMGRVRGARWGARVIDVDLIAYGAQVAPDPATFRHWADLPPDAQMRDTPDRLILPHPRMQDRAFVLVPLMDVAPDWVHPVLGQSVRQMHAALDPSERAQVWPVTS